jgi:DNA-binding transcriptional LysR family regulator
MNFTPYPFSLRQLKYVVAVRDLLSFNRAADFCHVSQPSLGSQIAELERALAITILFRSGCGRCKTRPARSFFTDYDC